MGQPDTTFASRSVPRHLVRGVLGLPLMVAAFVPPERTRTLARLDAVPDLTSVPTAPVLAAGLVGGFALAQRSGVRPLGAVAMLGANVVAARQWYAVGGAPLAAGLSAGYWTAMGVSHPLAKKIGTWPSVLGVTAVSAGAAWLLADRRTAR